MESVAGVLEDMRKSRAQLEAWIEERDRTCAEIEVTATQIRLATNRLDTLPGGQSAERVDAERELWRREQSLGELLTRLEARRSTIGLACVEQTRGGLWISTMHLDADWSDASKRFYWRETEAMRALAERLNDDAAATGEARFEAAQARQGFHAAMRRSATSAATRMKSPLRPSGIFAALPFLAFLATAAIGCFFAPRGLAAWITVATLLLITAIAFSGALREGPSVGVLAGLGAASSLALFTAAYVACSALDAPSVLRTGALPVPIETIGEACLVALTVGVAGDTLGVDLGGAASVVAFIQILLTISGVAAVVAVAWRQLSAKVRLPDDPNLG
jgi:hypothetical protein